MFKFPFKVNGQQRTIIRLFGSIFDLPSSPLNCKLKNPILVLYFKHSGNTPRAFQIKNSGSTIIQDHTGGLRIHTGRKNADQRLTTFRKEELTNYSFDLYKFTCSFTSAFLSSGQSNRTVSRLAGTVHLNDNFEILQN